MKKVLIGLGVIVLLLVAAAIALSFVVRTDRVVAFALEKAKAATGRDVQVKGPISLAYWPTLQIEAKDVAFANAPGSNGDMATARSMELGLETWPLVSSLFGTGEIRVTSFVLTDPVISLEVDKQGRKNWSFAEAVAEGKPVTDGTAAPPPAAASGSRIEDIHLGDVRLINGTISYADARTGTKQIVSGIDATVTLPGLDSPAAVKGSLTWNGKKVDIAIDAGAGRALLSGARTDLGLKIAADVVKVAFNGKGALDDTPDLSGTLDLDVPSIRDLAAWIGKPIAFDQPNTFGPLKINGRITGSPTRATLTDAAIAVDAFKGRGDLNVDLDAGHPTFKGRLDLERLDANPYLLAPADKPGTGTNAGAGDSARNAGWNTEPINFTPLRALEAELALTVNSLQYRKISAGKTALTVKMHGGKLTADLAQMALYDGTASGRFTVDGSGDVAGAGLALKLANVQADPLLRDSIGFERLGGRITGDIDVTTRGGNQKEMVAALGGRGTLRFTDGVIKGIDLLSMVRNVSTAFLDGGTGGAQRTDFSVLSGTFAINRGIMSNNDLLVQSRVLEVKGAGTIDLPRQTLHYRVEPELAKLEGVTVAVVIEGPWSKLGYRPDLTALLRDPGRTLDAIRNLRRDGGGLPGLLGGGRSNDQGSPGGLPLPLRNLFGR